MEKSLNPARPTIRNSKSRNIDTPRIGFGFPKKCITAEKTRKAPLEMTRLNKYILKKVFIGDGLDLSIALNFNQHPRID